MLPEASSATSAAVTFRPKIGSRAAAALLRTAVLVGVAVQGSVGSSGWVVWLVLVTLLPTTVISWLVVLGAWRAPWALRVDAAGIRWSPDGRPVPWTDVAEIEVHVARGLRRLLPHVSCVLLVTPAQVDFARRAGTRPIGSVVRLAHVRATPEALVAAFRPFTSAPARLRLR